MWLFVHFEDHSIIAVLQPVLSHPLIESISPLSRYTSHCGVTTKIHLKPLLKIVLKSGPASNFASTCFEMQPGLYCSMVVVPLWRSAYLGIGNCSTVHTKSSHATWIRHKKRKQTLGLNAIQNSLSIFDKFLEQRRSVFQFSASSSNQSPNTLPKAHMTDHFLHPVR